MLFRYHVLLTKIIYSAACEKKSFDQRATEQGGQSYIPAMNRSPAFFPQPWHISLMINPGSQKLPSKINPWVSHQVDASEIKKGDHIYAWRNGHTYSHHGIYTCLSLYFEFNEDILPARCGVI